MKRMILFIGILSLGLFAEGQMYAQKRGNDRRKENDRHKVEKKHDNKQHARNDDRRGNRTKVYTTKTRNGRNEKVVKRTVVTRRGYRQSEPRGNRNVHVTNVYYDYDFRNGRRHSIHRSAAPSSRHIWVNGYWQYDRRLRRDVWIAGHWTIKRDYHRWQPGRYSVIGGIRIWVPGVWIRVF